MQKNIDNGTTVLLADYRMMLTDGSSIVSVVRLGKEADESAWYEITADEAEAMLADETTDDTATAADYQAALREMGVKV